MNNSRLSSTYTSEGQSVSPAMTLHGNHPPDVVAQDASMLVSPKEPPGGEDTNVLVVDWDGPKDPKNPKK